MRFISLPIWVLAAALALAACGGEDEPPAQAWADDVCSRIDEWAQELREIPTGEGEGSVTERLRQGLDQAATATDSLVNDLREIGPPNTDSGAEAKDEVDALAESTKERVDRIRADAENAEGASDALQVAADVAAELEAAQQEAQQTFDRLRDLDPSGELREGIDGSEPCDELRSSVGG